MENKTLIKEPLLENVTLRDIIKNINLGLLQYSDEGNIRITNPSKPEFVIIVAKLEVAESILEFLKSETKYPTLQYNVDDFKKLETELELFDYVVLTLSETNKNQTQRIINIPLFELLIASDNLIADDSGKHTLSENDEIKWNIDSTGWYCYDIHYIEN